MGEFLETRCPCCGATDVNTRHTRLCHRSGVQVNEHQPLVHALSRTFERITTSHQMESGAPFNADRKLRTDMVIERGGLRDAAASEYRNKAILLDVTYADPQAVGHVRAGSADRDGLVASESEARKRSYKLATLALERFERLGKDGSDLIDRVAASIVGGTDGSPLARKDVCKERLSHIISVTTQVAI